MKDEKPDTPPILMRARDLVSKGRTDEAILEKSFALGYRQASAFSTAGAVCQQLKDYPKSLEYFDRAIELDPNYAFAYYNRSKVFHDMGDSLSAIADLERCLALTGTKRGCSYP